MTKGKVLDENGNVVSVGDVLTDFRGDKDVLKGIAKLPGGPSQGKLYTEGGIYYPSVFGCRIVIEEE